MTDQELEKLLRSNKQTFYNTLPFTGVRFNKWIIQKGYKNRRPKFPSTTHFRSSQSLATVLTTYYEHLIEASIEYPISLSMGGLGDLVIKETKIISGKERPIYNEDGELINVIDDYFINYPAHVVSYIKPSFGTHTPFMTYHKGLKGSWKLLRAIGKRHPKGKFYPFKQTKK